MIVLNKVSNLLLLIILCTSCQYQISNKKETVDIVPILELDTNLKQNKSNFSGSPPAVITRSIIQSHSGDIWFATFDGLIRYDGQTFENMSESFVSVRFFSAFEDQKGFLWFGTIGEGVYRFDGNEFVQYTMDDGLVGNQIVSIYEDGLSNIWFGAVGGASRYDGHQFQNYYINGSGMTSSLPDDTHQSVGIPLSEVNAILEDSYNNIWMATRSRTFRFDGESFNALSNSEGYFNNIRHIIKDRSENIWLGGNGGLWHYDGRSFKKMDNRFTGYIYEDRLGNIWTSADAASGWVLSKFQKPEIDPLPWTRTEVLRDKGMLFGILLDHKDNIWVGTLDGIRYVDLKDWSI